MEANFSIHERMQLPRARAAIAPTNPRPVAPLGSCSASCAFTADATVLFLVSGTPVIVHVHMIDSDIIIETWTDDGTFSSFASIVPSLLSSWRMNERAARVSE